MIVTNNQTPNHSSSNAPTENVQLRQTPQHNATSVQLRRADSNKSGGPSVASANNNNNSSGIIANNLNSPMMSANRASKQRPSQFQHNVTGNVNSVSSPSLLHSVPGPTAIVGGSSGAGHHNFTASGSGCEQQPLPCTFHFVCSRYLLFVVYLLLLLSLIVNTFLHFLIFGSNMSIGALFLDVHHRYELVVGDYDSLDPHTTDIYLSRDNWAHSPHHRPSADILHCDRDSFLSLLDEFYHSNPKSPHDSSSISSSSFDPDQSSSGSATDQLNRMQPPGRSKPYPKIFANFNKEQSRSESNSNSNPDEDQLYYSSSSTSTNPQGRVSDSQWQRLKRNEHRLLVIEVAALILLFVLVLTQILGLVAVMRKHAILLSLVTLLDSILFCLLVYVSVVGLIVLLLLAVLGGLWFVLQLKFGSKKATQRHQRMKEEMSSEMREVISQSGARMTPCIHVSMEQYEAMTQQMMHRYSSPIVYCPHYNESLC